MMLKNAIIGWTHNFGECKVSIAVSQAIQRLLTITAITSVIVNYCQ